MRFALIPVVLLSAAIALGQATEPQSGTPQPGGTPSDPLQTNNLQHSSPQSQSSDWAQDAVQKALSRQSMNALNLEEKGSNQTLALEGSCKAAIDFVATHDGIFDEWDHASQVASKKAAAYEQGIANLSQYKRDLLSDSWWRASSGADVAREVHTYCVIARNAIAVFSPIGDPVKTAEAFGEEVSARSAKVLEVLNTGGDIMDAIKTGTDGLAWWGVEHAVEQAGYGRAIAVVDILEAVQENAETAKQSAEYKATVQEQVDKLDNLMDQLGGRAQMEQEREQTYEAMKSAVLSACKEPQSSQDPGQPVPGAAEMQLHPTTIPTESTTNSGWSAFGQAAASLINTPYLCDGKLVYGPCSPARLPHPSANPAVNPVANRGPATSKPSGANNNCHVGHGVGRCD